MSDLNFQDEPKRVEGESKRKSEKPDKKYNVKSFLQISLSVLTAGVVGSTLTFAIAPQTEFFQKYYESVSEDDQVANQSSLKIDTENTKSVSPASNNSFSSIADIVEGSAPAIVGIVNIQRQNTPFTRTTESVESGTGSGVIIKKVDDAAYIVTNNHVVEGAVEIEVSLDSGDKTTAELVGADPLADLAVLRIDSKYAQSILKFGDSSLLRAGDTVIAIGNPLGLDFSRTVTQGIISSVERTIAVTTSVGEWDLDVIQTDAAINPGNSGGALINTQGQVIGINSLKISENGVEGLGFAIPSNDVVPIVNEIIETGKVERPYIGVSLASLEEIPQISLQDLPKDITEGAMVTYVDPGSAAAKAGLETGDVIVAINDSEVTSSNDLRKYLYTELEVGEKVSLTIYRGSAKKKVILTLTNNNVEE